MCAVSLCKSGSRLAQVAGSSHHPFFRCIAAMAHVEPAEEFATADAGVSEADERALIIACSSEVAAEAVVETGGVPVDDPAKVDEVETGTTAEQVSEITLGTDASVMRGGTLKVPYLITGREITTALEPSEMVLRGGRLADDVLLTDL